MYVSFLWIKQREFLLWIKYFINTLLVQCCLHWAYGSHWLAFPSSSGVEASWKNKKYNTLFPKENPIILCFTWSNESWWSGLKESVRNCPLFVKSYVRMFLCVLIIVMWSCCVCCSFNTLPRSIKAGLQRGQYESSPVSQQCPKYCNVSVNWLLHRMSQVRMYPLPTPFLAEAFSEGLNNFRWVTLHVYSPISVEDQTHPSDENIGCHRKSHDKRWLLASEW